MYFVRIVRKPFPAYQSSWSTLKYTGYAGACVFAVLFLLKPFGLDTFTTQRLFWDALLFGVVTFVLASFNSIVLPLLFHRLFNETRWNVGKEMLMMLWQFITITAGNIILAHYLYHTLLSFQSVFAYLWITLAVGIFPVGLIILLKQKMLLKKYAFEAKKIDEKLDEKISVAAFPNDQPVKAVTFYSENGKEQITVEAESIRYITSADNYIRIYYIEKGTCNSRLLRGTLRKAEEALSGMPDFFRCHRAYIANLRTVTHVSGNAQGYKLHLSGTNDLIPVSRNLNTTVKQMLLALHTSPQ